MEKLKAQLDKRIAKLKNSEAFIEHLETLIIHDFQQFEHNSTELRQAIVAAYYRQISD